MGAVNEDTTVIICKDKAELAYMCAWSESKGMLPPWTGERHEFPICICLGGGWTDSMDRALTYVPFGKFIQTKE